MTKLKDYLSLVKFSHTIFAMPFALFGFAIGFVQREDTFEWITLLYIVFCMIFGRNAAMGFNRYADREIDSLNKRTVNREIPSGIITSKSALLFVIINCILFIVTSFLINKLCFFLSPVALILLLGYSFTKRFTSLCHIILGLCLAIAPIGAYIAVTGKFAFEPIVLSLLVLTWTAGFDIIYSLQDNDFDKENNLFSIPAKVGVKNALIFSVMLHTGTFILVIAMAFVLHLHVLGWIGSAIFCGLLIYQHIIVKPNDFSKINIAFGTMNGMASVLYAGFTITDLLI